ncbi:MAG: hypothetical protein ACFCUI_11485 [Bernardetiaceae bacterium]
MEDNKPAIRESNNGFMDFIRNIEDRITALTTLEIKTIVGEMDVDSQGNVQMRSNDDVKVLYSRFNLIGGDVTSQISTELIYDKYQWLREFHERKEDKGTEIIASNIEAIFSLIELFKGIKASDIE